MARRPYQPKNLKLSHQPWKVDAVFQPIELILSRLANHGTIDTVQGKAVFKEDMKGGWYETGEAIQGVIDWHKLAIERHGIPCDTQGLEKLRAKLEYSAPVFEADITAARDSIDSCKRQALRLTMDQATDLLRTVQISIELHRAAIQELRNR